MACDQRPHPVCRRRTPIRTPRSAASSRARQQTPCTAPPENIDPRRLLARRFAGGA
ncbi:MAG: hypothetical protein MZV64_23955 [Ignavibacteriales bacterium]|nr:hypothetical protein [Ignavibacteriales bacterium]